MVINRPERRFLWKSTDSITWIDPVLGDADKSKTLMLKSHFKKFKVTHLWTSQCEAFEITRFEIPTFKQVY